MKIKLSLSLFILSIFIYSQDEIRYLTDTIYSADASAHLFDGKIFIYPSHDIETGVTDGTDGAHYNMKDYHVYSMDKIGGEITNHGVAFGLQDVLWASKQLWAPDAAHKDGVYYFYFPAKDKDGIFRIGVAKSNKPQGPFKPEKNYVKGTYSMDPAVYEDNQKYYLYFGGIRGGQLQKYRNNIYSKNNDEPAKDENALSPKIALLKPDMISLAEEPKDVLILDEKGNPIKAGDEDRRFFEGAWVHKFNGKYYLSYSTGTTHKICYAMGDNPYGPFNYQGVVMTPVKGWTTHHSIIEVEDEWYIFYHDTKKSGKNYLRNVKYRKLTHNPDGTIQTLNGLD
ncbi:glycoside hydrolase family 43 protein [Moheibacter sediminis]|uniref:Glycosyl hydrolases family 43 n=1 Tax=Moheibacter sediminis TaxID=1434700 RepID=A0A1W2CX38_9FLAO|nr:glycoside hydrolase family 43 protein [Moheibacter sediminis]SMC89248.1 Glycosyl hydrolases family 43 [Moheibacter sediminis]